MRIMVTGGAGFVGAVSVERLLAAGHEVTILDSLATGHHAAIPPEARLVDVSLLDAEAVADALRAGRIEAVLHCAARALVGESVANPGLYYRENVVGGLNLLEAMRATGVDRLCFSSSAAVYGIPRVAPIDEDQPLAPINPYGETKRVLEGMLAWFGQSYGLRAVALRYFNASGASATIGEDHRPETHLLPNALLALLDGPPLTIFGTDYPTADGTPIRDYVHVSDIAEAHLAALEHTATAEPGLLVCNLGSGGGFSVLEVLRVVEAVVGRAVPYAVGPRRAGDPPVLVASSERAARLLGWQPRHGSLEEIVVSAWAWRQAHPRGYSD